MENLTLQASIKIKVMKIHSVPFLLLYILFFFSSCVKSRDYYEEAYHAYKENDLEKAVTLLNFAIAQDSTCNTYQFLRSFIRIESRCFKVTPHDYQIVLAHADKFINPDNPDEENRKFYYALAMAYYYTGDIERFLPTISYQFRNLILK